MTLNEFNKEISSGNVLVDFWAEWCSPCRAMAIPLAELSSEGVKILKINVDNNAEIAALYKIISIPTFISYKNGQFNKMIIGVQTKQSLIDLLK